MNYEQLKAQITKMLILQGSENHSLDEAKDLLKARISKEVKTHQMTAYELGSIIDEAYEELMGGFDDEE